MMRSLCPWLILTIGLGIESGCCPGPRLDPQQTPVAVARDQRLVVRPLRGGKERRVTVPEGFVVVEPAPEPKGGTK